jgi:hypothetical protein
VTVRALIGLVLLNAAFAGMGTVVLWALNAYRWWSDVLRLGGVAYFVGIALTMVVLSLELALGIPVTGVAMGLTFGVVGGSSIVIGVRRGRPSPAVPPPGWSHPRISWFVAFSLAGIVLYIAGLFRQARLATALSEFDGWWNWIPKAKAIYFFGGLEPEFLLFLPNQSYPPGMPLVHAAAFHAMGGPDDVTLHVQYWFYALGFLAAVVGLLTPHVRLAILVPSLFLILLAPSFVTWATRTYVDLPLGYQIATSALLLALWVESRQTWLLVAATMLASGAMVTKREGLLFAVCLYGAALTASIGHRRVAWPRLALAAAIAVVLALPWRIWFMANGIPGDGPSSGPVGGLTDFDRGWASAKLVVGTLFATDVWLLGSIMGIIAIVLGLLAGAWVPSVYSSAFTVSAAAAAIWTIWSETALPITMADDRNPIVRLTGTSILVLLAFTPLLLDRAWTAARGVSVGQPVARRLQPLFTPSRAPWGVVAIAALLIPGSMLAGYSQHTLPGGTPRFPDVSDCVEEVNPGEPVRLVIGYAYSYHEANQTRARARNAGLRDVRISQDGCGRLRVYVDGLSRARATELVSSARIAGFRPKLEGVSG